MRLVIVAWEDSVQPAPAWVHMSEFSPGEPLVIASVGWLVHDDGAKLCLAPNVGGLHVEGQAQVSGVITIPRSCVKSITDLIEAGAGVTPRGEARQRRTSA